MSKKLTLRLFPPAGKRSYWRIRGTYLGRHIDRSSQARERKVARQVAEQIERDIERGAFAERGEPTFEAAVIKYLNHGGDARFVGRLLDHFQKTPLREFNQDFIDEAAFAFYPEASAATRNRQFYTPVSAILKRSGIRFAIERPEGSRGRKLLGWLWPDQAERLFTEADRIDPEFGLLLRVLCYTGMRLSEAINHFTVDGLRLDAMAMVDGEMVATPFAYIPKTKNGSPRPIHFPPHLAEGLRAHPRGLDRAGTVFRFHKGGPLYIMLRTAAEAAGVTLPERQAFHLFRHTYGTWMRRYAGLDARGLVGTGAWDSEQSTNRYAHTIASEDARRADLLPVGVKSGAVVSFPKKAKADQ